MKLILVVFAIVVSACLARPQQYPGNRNTGNPQDATIVQFDSNNIGIGPYSYSFQTSDGTSRQETAEIKNPGTADEYLEIKGQYSYIGANGETYTVMYIADKNGYQPTGTHLHRP